MNPFVSDGHKCLVLTLFASLILGCECADPERKKAEMKKDLKSVKKGEGKVILTNEIENIITRVRIIFLFF